MKGAEKRRSIAVISVFVVCVGVADRILAGEELPGGGTGCCFTQICGQAPQQQQATMCVASCSSGRVCSGSGGCTPSVWAFAECISHP